jgi:RNA polymerase sigma factor (sigma-70 family)
MKMEKEKGTDLGPTPEVSLYEQARGGCQDSLDLLMARHAGLVVHVVSRQNLGGLPFEEAVQEGRIALWRALGGYDPRKGYQFSTYAYTVIVHQIWKAVKDHCETNRREHALREWVVFFRHWEAGPAQQQAERELKTCLHALVAGLPERLQRVVRVRNELGGEERRTLAELGDEMGLSGERVRQLEVDALVWLRHPAHSQELRELLGRHSLQEYEWAEEVAQAWLRRRGGRRG